MILVLWKIVVSVASRSKMSDDKSLRSGYRGYVTRPIKKARDIIRNFEETDMFRLEGVRASLKENQTFLKNLNLIKESFEG